MKTAKLLTTSYYISKLSLAMQNDELICKKINDACDIMRSVDATVTSLTYAMSELMRMIIEDDDLNDYAYTDLLDKIASCFNLNRIFIIDFKDPLTNEVDALLQDTYETFNDSNDGPAKGNMCLKLHLTNNQLRTLIFCAIMKNSYDGSYDMLHKIYQTLFGKLIAADIPDASQWSIYQLTKDPGSCYLTLSYTSLPEDNVTADFDSNGYLMSNWNYFTLFFANMLTVKSAGIYYYINGANLSTAFKWADMPEDLTVNEHPEENDQTCWDFYNEDASIEDPTDSGNVPSLWM